MNKQTESRQPENAENDPLALQGVTIEFNSAASVQSSKAKDVPPIKSITIQGDGRPPVDKRKRNLPPRLSSRENSGLTKATSSTRGSLESQGSNGSLGKSGDKPLSSKPIGKASSGASVMTSRTEVSDKSNASRLSQLSDTSKLSRSSSNSRLSQSSAESGSRSPHRAHRDSKGLPPRCASPKRSSITAKGRLRTSKTNMSDDAVPTDVNRARRRSSGTKILEKKRIGDEDQRNSLHWHPEEGDRSSRSLNLEDMTRPPKGATGSRLAASLNSLNLERKSILKQGRFAAANNAAQRAMEEDHRLRSFHNRPPVQSGVSFSENTIIRTPNIHRTRRPSNMAVPQRDPYPRALHHPDDLCHRLSPQRHPSRYREAEDGLRVNRRRMPPHAHVQPRLMNHSPPSANGFHHDPRLRPQRTPPGAMPGRPFPPQNARVHQYQPQPRSPNPQPQHHHPVSAEEILRNKAMAVQARERQTQVCAQERIAARKQKSAPRKQEPTNRLFGSRQKGPAPVEPMNLTEIRLAAANIAYSNVKG